MDVLSWDKTVSRLSSWASLRHHGRCVAIYFYWELMRSSKISMIMFMSKHNVHWSTYSICRAALLHLIRRATNCLASFQKFILCSRGTALNHENTCPHGSGSKSWSDMWLQQFQWRDESKSSQTWRVELCASCSRARLAPSVIKPFWKMYVFKIDASTTYTVVYIRFKSRHNLADKIVVAELPFSTDWTWSSTTLELTEFMTLQRDVFIWSKVVLLFNALLGGPYELRCDFAEPLERWPQDRWAKFCKLTANSVQRFQSWDWRPPSNQLEVSSRTKHGTWQILAGAWTHYKMKHTWG